MRSLVVTLTSLQVQTAPSVLNHWFITADQTDSGSTTFTYPDSANGSDPFIYTTQPTVTADGGNMYPWGYPIANTITNINLGKLKGPYTITFSPSGIDSRYYDISKIGYTFGDGTSQTVEKSIIQNSVGNSITGGLPTNVNVSHAYYPSSTNTTFTPSVTVINSNLVLNIFNISFTLTPASIYDFNDVHLISNTQPNNNQFETVNIFEIESPNYVTNVRAISSTYDTDVLDFVNAQTTAVPSSITDALNSRVKGLKSSGIWDQYNLNLIDIDASAFITTAGITDIIGKAELALFATGVKNLRLWNNLICWPMRSYQNGSAKNIVYPFGGYNRDNTLLGNIKNKLTWGVDGLMSSISATDAYIEVLNMYNPSPTPSVMYISNNQTPAVINRPIIYGENQNVLSVGNNWFLQSRFRAYGGDTAYNIMDSYSIQDQFYKRPGWNYVVANIDGTQLYPAVYQNGVISYAPSNAGTGFAQTITSDTLRIYPYGTMSFVAYGGTSLLPMYNIYKLTLGYGLSLP